MKLTKLKPVLGFTLIELLVVIAIISILAGVVLTGVTGFQANARDTKRIGDLKNIQPSIELYFARCGHYPGGANCSTTFPTNWTTLSSTLLTETGARISNDPLNNATYFYTYMREPNGLGYVLKAVLEKSGRVLGDGTEIDTVDSTWQTTSGERNCADATLNYCIGS